MAPISNAGNLGGQAFNQLRDSIITLQLEPGQTVQENELAESLGISRTPIRDAFHLLISEKLIEVLPQRTKKVALISETKVLESAMVRLSLESSAFRIAAREWENDERHRKIERVLLSILEDQQEAAASQNVVQFLSLDEMFHHHVLMLTGNETLLEMVYRIRGHLNRFRYLAMKELVLTKQLVKEHEQLLSSLKARDEAHVIAMLEQHLGKLHGEIAPLRERFPQYFQA